MIGIYKITSPTGKVYIGQSWNIFDRWIDHKGVGQRRCENRILVNSIRKHGHENHTFEILHNLSFLNKDEIGQGVLNEYEIFYISQYKLIGAILMNMTDGGQGKRGYKTSEETRRKLSLLVTGTSRKPHSVETRKKISLAHKGKKKPSQSAETIAKRTSKIKGQKRTEEQRRKMSEVRKGMKFTEEHKKNLSLNWRNNHPVVSEATREKLRGKSPINKGVPMSDEQKKIISIMKMGNKNRVGKFHSEETKKKIKDSWVIRKLKNVQSS